MVEVLKDSFETRMKIREFEAKIKNLAKRVNEIENKQANRFPHLIERLDSLEKEIADLKKNEYFRSGTAVPITKDDAEGGSW